MWNQNWAYLSSKCTSCSIVINKKDSFCNLSWKCINLLFHWVFFILDLSVYLDLLHLDYLYYLLSYLKLIFNIAYNMKIIDLYWTEL